jgi:hypothetical protein
VEGCLAEKEDVKQWGEWLRASPRKPPKSVSTGRPAVSLGSYSSRPAGAGFGGNEGVSIRDLPPRRKLSFPRAESFSSRTGGHGERRDGGDVTSPYNDHRVTVHDRLGGKAPMDVQPRK